MSGALQALEEAMRRALIAHGPLRLLLGGAHVHAELPRGAQPPFVEFGAAETRDRSTADARAHEHIVTLQLRSGSRSRALAQQAADEIGAALDGAALALEGHRLVDLRLVFWSVGREKSSETYGASLRFRAATEPLEE